MNWNSFRSYYANIALISIKLIANSDSMRIDGFISAKSSSVRTRVLRTRTTLSTKSPPKIETMKNAPVIQMPKNHLSNRWLIQRFPPPINGIKQSTVHDTTSFEGNLNRLRMVYKVITATVNSDKIKAITILTKLETRKISIERS